MRMKKNWRAIGLSWRMSLRTMRMKRNMKMSWTMRMKGKSWKMRTKS